MKQLRHILYLNQPDIALKVEGQALCAVCGDGKKEKIPFHLLEGIVSFSYAGITPAVLTACAERGIRLSALTPSGRVRFQVIGETRGNVLLRMRQYQMSGQEEAMAIARAMLGESSGIAARFWSDSAEIIRTFRRSGWSRAAGSCVRRRKSWNWRRSPISSEESKERRPGHIFRAWVR